MRRNVSIPNLKRYAQFTREKCQQTGRRREDTRECGERILARARPEHDPIPEWVARFDEDALQDLRQRGYSACTSTTRCPCPASRCLGS